MIVKKLAIASAATLMLASMGAAQAQVSTPTESTTVQETGLMTELTNALSGLLSSGRLTQVEDFYNVGGVLTSREFTYAAPTVDITAIAGAVNLSTINGSIDISGTNVSITGVAGEVSAKAEAIGETTSDATSFAINGSNYATTVIGAMNSSTLDVMGRTVNLSEMTKSMNNMGVLSTQGLDVDLGSVAFTSQDLGLETSAGDILDTTNIGSIGGEDNTQFNMQDLVSGTDSLASSMTEELQTMAVFNMALNAAPIVAGVKIAAIENTEAWFLNPQTGILNLSNMQIATTAIGAMNSSVTRLGANLANLAE